jgi:hypothetical protein
MAWLPLFNCNGDEVLRSGSPGNLFVAVFAGFEPFLFPPSPFRAAQARRRVPWPPPLFRDPAADFCIVSALVPRRQHA